MRVHLTCLTVSVLAGCARPPPPARLAIATVRQPATSLFLVARDAGCFAREGLALDERSFELGRDALALLRAGGADVAIAYETPFLAAAREDPTLRALTSLHSSTRNTRLVARRARVRAFEDLAGKQVGLAPGTNAEFFLDRALRYARVPRAAVQVVGLAPEEAVEALRAGALDAAVLSDPAAARAEAAVGDPVVLRSDLYVEFSLLVARAETIARRRPALAALLRGLACGEELARRRPDEAFALVRARFPAESEPALRAQLARVSWGIGLDHLLLQALAQEGEWLRARAPAAPVPPAARLLEVGLLEEVAPEAVLLVPAPVW